MAQRFEGMTCWQEAITLAVEVYDMTKSFPRDEQFGLTNQLRRAASSISANIAEGFGRQTNNDKSQFYTIAYGSLLEVKSFIYLAERLGYIKGELTKKPLEDITLLQKRINALKRTLTNA